TVEEVEPNGSDLVTGNFNEDFLRPSGTVQKCLSLCCAFSDSLISQTDPLAQPLSGFGRGRRIFRSGAHDTRGPPLCRHTDDFDPVGEGYPANVRFIQD